jgi:hypothetical protein
MSGAFRGVVNLDIRESTPDRVPFSRPVTPNRVHAVLDDAE